MPTERVLPSQTNNGGMADDTETEQKEPVKILEKQGTFDEFVVWAHEEVPALDDVYVKGVEEWLRLAEVVRVSFFCLRMVFELTVLFRCIRANRRQRSPIRKRRLSRGLMTIAEHIYLTTLRITIALDATLDVSEVSYFVVRHGNKKTVHSSLFLFVTPLESFLI